MEKQLAAMLRRGMKTGAIEVAFASGRRERFGDGSGPQVKLRVNDPAAARAIWMDPNLGFAEQYMRGGLMVEDGDIYDLIAAAKQSGARNFASTPAVIREIGRMLHRKLRRYILPETARRNVAHHYDLDERLFRLFLDKDLQYSCAYYETGDETLEEAQRKKKRHIAAKMRLKPGQRVLDIGCGWGGMGLYLAQAAGVDVVGVTLSEEQCRVANTRAAELGLADRCAFLLQDYRTIEGRFDRVVSVGMFEHVGPHRFDDYFQAIHRLLTDDGVALIHSIGRAKPNRSDPPFIEKYIFPNGHIPSLSETLPTVERAKFLVKDIEILTYHYADTLREWRRRFHTNRDAALKLYDETFFRMWDLYLIASEVSFRHGKLANFQIQLMKRHDDVPRTRAYIAEEETRLAAAEPPL